MYSGEVKGKLRHGRGLYEYPNQYFVYDGEWKDGVKQDGGYIKAQFVNGEIEGEGERHYPDGSVYRGGFSQGEFHGEGSMEYANGDNYEGEWVYNQRHGQGRLVKADGSVFEGEFERHREKNGTQQLADGSVYTGEFHDGFREGQGTLEAADGSRYEGEWKADCRHGQGIEKSGELVYEGEWSQNKPIHVPVRVAHAVGEWSPPPVADGGGKGKGKGKAPVVEIDPNAICLLPGGTLPVISCRVVASDEALKDQVKKAAEEIIAEIEKKKAEEAQQKKKPAKGKKDEAEEPLPPEAKWESLDENGLHRWETLVDGESGRLLKAKLWKMQQEGEGEDADASEGSAVEAGGGQWTSLPLGVKRSPPTPPETKEAEVEGDGGGETAEGESTEKAKQEATGGGDATDTEETSSESIAYEEEVTASTGQGFVTFEDLRLPEDIAAGKYRLVIENATSNCSYCSSLKAASILLQVIEPPAA